MFRPSVARKLMDMITDSLIFAREPYAERAQSIMQELVGGDEGRIKEEFQKLDHFFFREICQHFTESLAGQFPDREAAVRAAVQRLPETSTRCEELFSAAYRAITEKEPPKRKVLAVRRLQDLAIQDVMIRLSKEPS